MNPRELKIGPLQPPEVHSTEGLKFLQKVRVKESASQLIHLENSEWVKFYAGATGQVVRYNPEDGMMVVLLDTGDLLPENNKIMEPFYPADLESIE